MHVYELVGHSDMSLELGLFDISLKLGLFGLSLSPSLLEKTREAHTCASSYGRRHC